METRTEVINLKDGYYIKRWNRFDGDKLLWTKEKHYDNWGRVVGDDMFQLNDCLWSKRFKEVVKLVGIEFDRISQRMIYYIQTKELDYTATDFFDLVDLRYK